MSGTRTLAPVERRIWRETGWRIEQRAVDRILAEVRAYAADPAEEPCPCTREATYSDPPPGETPQRPAQGRTAPPMAEDTTPRAETRQTAAQSPLGRVTNALPARSGSHWTPRPMREAREGEESRTCRTCRQAWAIEEFSRDTTKSGGRKNVCRTCENTRRRDARRAKTAARRTNRKR